MKGKFNFYGFGVYIDGPFYDFFLNEYSFFKSKKITETQLIFKYVKDKSNHSVKDYDVTFNNKVKIVKKVIFYNSHSNFTFLINLFEATFKCNNKILVHGIAFQNENKTFFIAGPDDTGKTSLSINLSDKKKTIFSEDWSCVDNLGFVYPWPRKCHVFDYNIVQSFKILKKRFNYSFFFYKNRSLFKDWIKINSKFLNKAYHYLMKEDYKTLSFEDLGGITAQTKKKIDFLYWFQKKKINNIKIKKISRQNIINRITGHYLYERSEYFKIGSRFQSLGENKNVLVSNLILNNNYQKNLKKFINSFKIIKEIQIPKKMNTQDVSDYIYRLSIKEKKID